MTTTDQKLEARAAIMAAGMITDELFEKYEDIQVVGHGTFVVTVRSEAGVHVVAGTAKECLAKLENDR